MPAVESIPSDSSYARHHCIFGERSPFIASWMVRHWAKATVERKINTRPMVYRQRKYSPWLSKSSRRLCSKFQTTWCKSHFTLTNLGERDVQQTVPAAADYASRQCHIWRLFFDGIAFCGGCKSVFFGDRSHHAIINLILNDVCERFTEAFLGTFMKETFPN